MKFEISESTQRIINAWHAAAEILESADMRDFTDIHNDDTELIQAIDGIAVEMHRISEEIEREQKMMLESLQIKYEKKISDYWTVSDVNVNPPNEGEKAK